MAHRPIYIKCPHLSARNEYAHVHYASSHIYISGDGKMFAALSGRDGDETLRA